MEVIIHNFCCYDGQPRSFRFQSGKISLLNGPSGKGKSTILEAVFWALYGKRRDIVPHRSKKNIRSEVTVQMGNIIVKRVNHPAVLQVMYGEAQIDGPVAQAFIDEKFGSPDVWKSTSYIDQKNACQLLTGTPASRIAILNRLAFKGEESPEYYIEQINQALQESKASYNALYVRDFARLEELRVQLQGKVIPAAPERLIENIRDEYLACQQFLDGARQEFERQKICRSKHEVLSQQLVDLQKILSEMLSEEQYEEDLQKCEEDLQKWVIWERLSKLKEEFPNIPGNFTEEAINYEEENLRSEIRKLHQQLGNIEVADLQARLNMLDSTLGENQVSREELDILEREIIHLNGEITAAEEQKILEMRRRELQQAAGPFREEELKNINLSELAEYERKYHHNAQLAVKMGFSYDPQVIEQVRLAIQRDLQLAKSDLQSLQKFEELQQYKQEFCRLRNMLSIPHANPEDLFALQKQEKELDSVLTCPHCRNSLRMANGQLIPLTIPSGIQNRDTLREYISHYQQNLQIKEKLQFFQQLMDKLQLEIPANFNPQLAASTDLNQIIHNAETLKEIVYMKPPQRNMEQWKALDELSKLPQLSPVTVDISLLIEKRETAVGRRAILQEKLTQREAYQRELTSLQNQANILRTLQQTRERLYAWASCYYSSNYIEQPEKSREELIIQREQSKQSLVKKQETSRKLQILQSELSSVSYDKEFLEKFSNEEARLLQLREEYLRAQEIIQLRNQFQEFSEKSQALNSAQSKLTNIEKLRSRAIEIQSQYLQSLGNDLVRNTRQILSELFEDPISLEMNLVHTVKKTQNLVSGIDWKIYYKGGVYENIGRFSGGEEKRISLAVVLALQRMHNSRILFLDEVFSAVDLECQVKCLNFIQQITSLRGVVTVMVIHNETGDAIDEVVNID